jgi:alkylphosphonate utilization operon protein PhnA
MSKNWENTDWDNWEYDENDDWTWNNLNQEIIVKDANWNKLESWDTVIAIKDLPVKGGQNIKRWDKFKNIKLTDDIELIESWKMVLRTEFFKKA